MSHIVLRVLHVCTSILGKEVRTLQLKHQTLSNRKDFIPMDKAFTKAGNFAPEKEQITARKRKSS